MGEDDAQEGLAEVSNQDFSKALVLLGSEDDHDFFTLDFPYMGIYWRGCPNIFFTVVEPPDERGNISFKLI